MISINRRTLYGEVFNDVRCLSSDEKPTEGIKNGSTLIEIDTGKKYLFDALSGSWNEFSQGGGEGGEYVLPTMSQSVKGGATLGEGLSMSGDSLSVDYSKVASKQSLDDATKVDPDGGLKRTTEGLSADYAKVASVESLESATKLEADGGIKRTSNGLSIDYSEVASVDALEDATALSPTGGIVSTQDGLAISPTQQTNGAIDGALLELTAKSKPATQDGTPSPDNPVEIVTVTGHEVTGKEGRYVSLERRDSQGTLLDTTPIPLPPRGWVAGLQDTADKLTVDGAGKVVWTLPTSEVVLDGDEDIGINSTTQVFTAFGIKNIFTPVSSNSDSKYKVMCDKLTALTSNDMVGTSPILQNHTIAAISSNRLLLRFATSEIGNVNDLKTWLASHPVTVLYPLATPVTEDCGYIEGWTNDFSEGCVLSIPELDDLGIKYHIDGAVSKLVHQWYERVDTEHRAVLEEIEDAVVDLAEDMASAKVRLDELGSIKRNADGYYDNASVTNFLARRFDGKVYGYSEPKTDATDVTKTGANSGLPNPTLGTIDTKGESVYRRLGPFQWWAAKGYVDADGVPHVKVIRGVDSEKDWAACTDNVWSLRPVVYYSVDDSGVSVSGLVSDTWHTGLKPNPRAYLPDGTLRPYMLAARHGLGFEGSEGVSKPNLKGYGRNVSHNSLITQLKCATTGYSGKTEYEEWYECFMFRMIYGSKDSQSVMRGCSSYSYQYHPTVAETGVKRVILANADAANLLVGSTMMMGNQASKSTDRNNANCYNVFDGLVISSIEDYDADNKAVYFDTDSTFSTDTAYLLSTAPWHTGSCGDMDWDGTPTQAGATSGKEPMFFQGCELMNGNTEILGDVIISSDVSTGWIPFVNQDTKKEATSVTSDYVSCVDSLPVSSADGWKYPLYLSDHGGLMYGTQTGGSQSTGICDGHYTNKVSTAGTREWQSLGNLSSGGYAGLSYVVGNLGLTYTDWSIWSRVSGVGRSKLVA